MGPTRVLVVDDEEDVQQTVPELLRACGYEVRVAKSGDEALQACAADPVDVVLADVVMPGMTGIELARRLKGANPELPVVLMTGHSDRVDEVIAAGGVPLMKPFATLTLQRIITEALDRD